jgi:hypothetical protein
MRWPDSPAIAKRPFHSDGKYTSQSSIQGPTATILVKDSGTWKLEGEDNLTVVYTDIDWQVQHSDPQVVKRVRDRFLSEKSSMIAEANKMSPIKLDWKGNDEFVATLAGKTYSYRRKK